MKWIPQDIEMYLANKRICRHRCYSINSIIFWRRYETIRFNGGIYYVVLTGLLERQFTGRILLLPPFTYLKLAMKVKIESS